jgi:predicted metal-binding protein
VARIGILTCSNCTQESDCASVVCLADLRKRRGFFERYSDNEPLDLVGIINCAGCPTNAAPEKIIKRVRALADYGLDALHLSFCMTALCPFIGKYQKAINKAYPDLDIVPGTHKPIDKETFQQAVRELLCQTIKKPQTMNDVVKGTMKLPEIPPTK